MSMEEWKEYSLSDIAKYSQGKQIPIQLQYEEKNDSLIRFIRIVDYTSIWNQPPRYVLQDSKYHIKSDDIVMIRYGTPGKVFRGHEGLIANNMFKISVNEDIIDKGYAFWYLSLEQVFKQLMSFQASTTMPAISFGMLRNIIMKVPSKTTQRKIAKILDTIDDKIEVNRRINDNLEQQAQALYKLWFVDNRSEDWEEVKLSQIVDINKDSINPSLYPNTIFEHYSLPAYDAEILPVCEKGSDIKSSKFIINDNVILFSKLNPRIKRIWLPNPQTEHAICSTEFVPYQPKKSEMLGFCYSLLNSDDFYDFVLSLTNGSTGSHQRFHPKDTLDYNFRVPKIETISKFEDKVIPLYRIISKNRIENQKLTALRDTLLPKLMSGELNVNDVLVD